MSSRPIHVDFLRIGEHSKVTVAIPVRFDNEEESPGIKRGGVLNVVRHELELVCDAAHIPDEIHIALDGPRHRRFASTSARSRCPRAPSPAIDDRDFTVATIVAPSAMKAEEAEAAAEAAADEVPTVEGEEGEAEGEAEAGEAEGGERRLIPLDSVAENKDRSSSPEGGRFLFARGSR